jgi:hypothetical protein
MNRVSTGKIIKNDYAAFLMTIGGPIALAISAFTAFYGFVPHLRGRGGQEVDPQSAIVICVVAGLVTVLLLLMLAKRISRLKRILQTGSKLIATVTDVAFFKDRGRVEFHYIHDGEDIHAGTAIMKNKETEAIISGAQIEVAIDPANPKKALIVRLYCSA